MPFLTLFRRPTTTRPGPARPGGAGRAGRLLTALCGCLLPLLLRAQAPVSGVPIPSMPFWEWQLPQPTGFGVDRLHVFNDSTVIAAGGHGTALKTANYGRTWQVLNTGIDREITSVSFANAQVGWMGYTTLPTVPTRDYQAGPGRVLCTADGGLTWASQGIGDAVSSIFNPTVAAVSPTEAYLAYQRNGIGPAPNYYSVGFTFEVRHTTNGGQSWAVLPVGTTATGASFQSFGAIQLRFFTPATGFLHTKNIYLTASYLYRTADHGQTWQDIGPAAGNGGRAGFVVTDVCFLDAQRGWAVGLVPNAGSFLYRTADGGQSWTAGVVPDPNSTYYSLAFADPLHGRLHSLSPYGLPNFLTDDGGLTWTPGLYDRHFAAGFNPTVRLQPSGAGWQVDRYPGVLRTTTDFGRTWRSRTTAPAAVVRGGMAFPDATHGWALPTYYNAATPANPGDLDRTAVLHTTRRGAPWQRQDLAALGPYLELAAGAFPDADTAWVAGNWVDPAQPGRYSGTLLGTTNGGRTWVRQPLPPATPPLTALASWGTRRLLALANDGAVYVSRSGGQRWAAPVRPAPARRRLYCATWADSATVYVTTDTSVFYKSTDAGRTWRAGVAPNQMYEGQFFTFTSARVGYAPVGGGLAKTTDGGLTWVGVVLVPPNGFSGNAGPPEPEAWNLCFTTARKGWVFGFNDVLRTNDAGQTWQHVAYVGAAGGGQASGGGPSVAIDDYNAFGAGSGISHYSEKFVQADTLAAQPRRYCAGQALTLAYTVEGTLTAAERAALRVQLSNPMGRFRKGQTWLLAPAPGGTATALRATLPAGLPAGSRYRLRVITADSALLGGDNQRDITIDPMPAAVAVAPAGPQTLCAGSSLTLSAPTGAAQYRWNTGATTRTLAVRAGGSYSVQVAGVAGCFGPPSAAVAVVLVPLPAVPVLAYAPGGPVTVAAPVAGVSYQWFRNGTLQAGVSGPRFPATGPAPVGTYTAVAVSAAGGCLSPASAPVAVVLAVRAATQAELRLFPNPAREVFFVERAEGSAPAELTVLDALGRCQWQGTLRGGQLRVPVQGLAPGLYVVRLHSADGSVVVRRMAVEH